MGQKLLNKQLWLQRFYQNFVRRIKNLKVITVIRFEVVDGIEDITVFSTYNKYVDFNAEIAYQEEYYSQVILREVIEDITIGDLISIFKSLKRVKQKR